VISDPKKYIKYLVPIFLAASLVILLRRHSWFNIPITFLGLAFGAALPDLDHLIYWLWRAPNSEISQLVRRHLTERQFKPLLSLIKSQSGDHDNLIFHHFFGHSIITILSFFIFSSTGSTFAQALILALNLHLFIDVYTDWRLRPAHLQSWLFAREPKQLTLNNLKYYVLIFFACNLLYLGLFFLNL
jgi:hypothetical protein